MREILKGAANLAVAIATASRKVTESEVWEGEEVAREPVKPIGAKRQRPSKKEQYLWKKLDEVDREVTNEERRATEKKKRAVDKARQRKGAGASQPSILSKFRTVAKSSKESAEGEQREGDHSSQGEQDECFSREEEQRDHGLCSIGGGLESSKVSVAQLSSQDSMHGETVCSEVEGRFHECGGSMRAEECGMGVALLSKPSVCTVLRGDINTDKRQGVANTKPSKKTNSKGGAEGSGGVAGSSKGRGEVESLNVTKTDTHSISKKQKVIHPKVEKLHNIFEGTSSEVKKNLQNSESSPMKRKLHVLKNTRYLVDKFSKYY